MASLHDAPSPYHRGAWNVNGGTYTTSPTLAMMTPWFDRVPDLPRHDQPELGAFRMIVTLILRVDGRQIFLMAVNKVGHSAIAHHHAIKRRGSASLEFPGQVIICHDRLVPLIKDRYRPGHSSDA